MEPTEQIAGRLALEKSDRISHETIYQRILKDKKAGGTLSPNVRIDVASKFYFCEKGRKVNEQMGHPNYSEAFKKAAVEKTFNRGSQTMDAIAEEMGVSSRALCRWRTKFAYKTQMQPTSKRPQDYDAEEIFQTLLEFEKLTEEKRGEFLRKKGLHTEHLKLWREQIKVALHPAKQSRIERSEKAQDRRKIKELERELRRKDKALAEATALLILKKKANLIWGTGEDE